MTLSVGFLLPIVALRKVHSLFSEMACSLSSTPACTENVVRIDLEGESLNVGRDGRADISRELAASCANAAYLVDQTIETFVGKSI